jgi:hypothetical protein
VEEGHRAQDHLVLFPQAREPGPGLQGVGDEVAVGEHRALGRAGRAPGVLQEGHVRGQEARPGRRRRVGAEELVEEGDIRLGRDPRAFAPPRLGEARERPGRPREALGHVHHDRTADAGRGVDLPQAREELVEEDERLAARVPELLAHLPRHVHRVRVDRDRADAQGAVERDHELRAVRQHDRHPVALPHPELEEGGRDAQAPLAQLAPAEGGNRQPRVEEEADRHLVRHAGRGAVEELGQGDVGNGDRVRDALLVVPEPGAVVRGRHGAGTFGVRSSSIRTRRRYFPTIDFGSSLRNSTLRGTLNTARCKRQNSTISSSLAVSPGFRTM